MLAAANIREHWRAFLATFLAVVVGVDLIAVTLILYDSGQSRLQPRLADAAVLVVSNQAANQSGAAGDRVPWSESEAGDLVQQLEEIDGVGTAIIDRNFYAQAFADGRPVADEAAMEAGHGWSSILLAPYKQASGRAPTSDSEVVVGIDLGVPTGSAGLAHTGAAGHRARCRHLLAPLRPWQRSAGRRGALFSTSDFDFSRSNYHEKGL